MNKWAAIIITAVLVIAGVIYGIYQATDYDFNDATKSYRIVKQWELPHELEEVSGIHWIDDEKIACVQDEDGIIFIFDLNASEVVKEYKFAGSGDYEALTYMDGEYWVAESNGKLFNVKDLEGREEEAEEFELDFEYRNNIEGLAVKDDGTLWLAVKDRNLDNSGDYKGIYSYDPSRKKLNFDPVLKISYKDFAFKRLKTGNPRKLVRPSDLAFHPLNDDIYVLDAEFQKFLILNESGKIKALHLLDPEEFSQPEGLCFSPSGRMFIANEGLGGSPNIIEIEILK